MTSLKDDIESLSPELVTETLKNLRITLQYYLGHELPDADVAERLRQLPLEGAADDLRGQILADEHDPKAVARWGKALLALLASDEELRPQVEEAIEDARAAGTMDVILPTLVILGAVVVLLKWRPKTLVVKPGGGLRIDWDENDVSVVSDLAQAAALISKQRS